MVCVDFGQLTMKDLRRHAEINHHETFEDAQVCSLLSLSPSHQRMPR